MSNIDPKTVSSFGVEWVRFDQEALGDAKHAFLFDTYFHIFPWDSLPEESEGFSMGWWVRALGTDGRTKSCQTGLYRPFA